MRDVKCVCIYIYEAQSVTLHGDGCLLLVQDCGLYVNITNCFLIRCESVSCILILFRDHYGAIGNSSLLMDDASSQQEFPHQDQWSDGRMGEIAKPMAFCSLQSCNRGAPFSAWRGAASKVNHTLIGALWRFNVPRQRGDRSQ